MADLIRQLPGVVVLGLAIGAVLTAVGLIDRWEKRWRGWLPAIAHMRRVRRAKGHDDGQA